MATLWSAKFGLERRGRHHSPPPKPVTAASALRNSGAQRVVSVLNESFAVRIIPLKPSPDKVFSGGRPAREPVLGSGGELDSAGQVGRLTTAPHFEKRCPDARVFYCGTGVPMTQKSLQNQPVPQFEQRHRRRRLVVAGHGRDPSCCRVRQPIVGREPLIASENQSGIVSVQGCTNASQQGA
jgi:hypothetical protein